MLVCTRFYITCDVGRGGHATQHQYDLAGRQVPITHAFGTAGAQISTYTYDAAGNHASMSSNHTNSVSATYSYDDRTG
jgi:YD repeat-containing protein